MGNLDVRPAHTHTHTTQTDAGRHTTRVLYLEPRGWHAVTHVHGLAELANRVRQRIQSAPPKSGTPHSMYSASRQSDWDRRNLKLQFMEWRNTSGPEVSLFGMILSQATYLPWGSWWMGGAPPPC